MKKGWRRRLYVGGRRTKWMDKGSGDGRGMESLAHWRKRWGRSARKIKREYKFNTTSIQSAKVNHHQEAQVIMYLIWHCMRHLCWYNHCAHCSLPTLVNNVFNLWLPYPSCSPSMTLSSTTLLIRTLSALLLRDGHITQVVVEVGERLWTFIFFTHTNYLFELVAPAESFLLWSLEYEKSVKHIIISRFFFFLQYLYFSWLQRASLICCTPRLFRQASETHHSIHSSNLGFPVPPSLIGRPHLASYLPVLVSAFQQVEAAFCEIETGD